MNSPNPITVGLRVQDSTYEAPLRERFTVNLPEAVLEFEVQPTENFADIVKVTGDCRGPEKPMVKAQEIVGDFNLAMRERKESGASATVT